MKAFTLFILSLIVYNVSSTRSYDELCKSSRNGEFLKHSLDCHKFIRCSHGKAYEFQCPANLLWHHEIKTCDYAYRTNCKGGGMVTGVLTNKELSLENKFKKTRKKLKEINDKNVKIFSTKKPKVTVAESLPLNVKNMTHSMLITSNFKRKEEENGNDNINNYSDKNYNKLSSYSWQPQQFPTSFLNLTYKENSTVEITDKESESFKNSSNTKKNENSLSLLKLKEKFTNKLDKKEKDFKGSLSGKKENFKQNLTAKHTVKLTEEKKEMLKENMTTESSFTETLLKNITKMNLISASANKTTKLKLETTTLNTELNIETVTREKILTDQILADAKLTEYLLRENQSSEDNLVKYILTDLPQTETVITTVKITELENAQLISTTKIPSVITTEDTATVNHNFYNSADNLKENIILKEGFTTESFGEINKEIYTSVIENSKDSVNVTDKITEEDYNLFQTTEISKASNNSLLLETKETTTQPFTVKITEEEHNSFQAIQSFVESYNSSTVDNKATASFSQNTSKSLTEDFGTTTESSAAFNSSSTKITEEGYNLHNSSESSNKNKDSTPDIFKDISQTSPVISLSFNSSVGLTSATAVEALQDKFNFHNSTNSSTSLKEVSQTFTDHNSTESSTSLEDVSQTFTDHNSTESSTSLKDVSQASKDHIDRYNNSNELKNISNSTAWETEINISNSTESSLKTTKEENSLQASTELSENFDNSTELKDISNDIGWGTEVNVSNSTESSIKTTKEEINLLKLTETSSKNYSSTILENYSENVLQTSAAYTQSSTELHYNSFDKTTEHFRKTTESSIENISSTILENQTPSKEVIQTPSIEVIQTPSKEVIQTSTENFNSSAQLTVTSAVKITEKELNISNTISKEDNSSKVALETFTESFNSSTVLTVSSIVKIPEKELNITNTTESLIENTTKSYIENISNTISKEDNSSKVALETFTESFNSSTILTVSSTVKIPEKELNITNTTDNLIELTTESFKENINNTISKKEISTKEDQETFTESFDNSTHLTQTSFGKITEKELNISNTTESLIELTTESFEENVGNTISKNSLKDVSTDVIGFSSQLTEMFTIKTAENEFNLSDTTSSMEDNKTFTLTDVVVTFTDGFINATIEDDYNLIYSTGTLLKNPNNTNWKPENPSTMSGGVTENLANPSETIIESFKQNIQFTNMSPIKITNDDSNLFKTTDSSFVNHSNSTLKEENSSNLKKKDLIVISLTPTVTTEDFKVVSTDKTTEEVRDLKSSTKSSKEIDTSSSFVELSTQSALIENFPGFAEGFALVTDNSKQFSKTTHDFARDTIENEENFHNTLENSNEILKSFTKTIENTERIIAEAYEDVPDIRVTVNENSVNTEEYSKGSTTESSTETKENIKYNFITFKEDFKEISLTQEVSSNENSTESFIPKPNEINTSDNLEESYEIVSTSTENSIVNSLISTEVNSKQNLIETAKAFTESITTDTETFTYTTTELEQTLSNSAESSFENHNSPNLIETNTKESLNGLPEGITKTSVSPVDLFNLSEEFSTEITENGSEMVNTTENFNENLKTNIEAQTDSEYSKESFYESLAAATEISNNSISFKLETTKSSPYSENYTETLTQIQSSTVPEATNETFKEALENIIQSEAIPPKAFNSSDDLAETSAVDSVVQKNKEMVSDNEELETFFSSNETLAVTYSSEETESLNFTDTLSESTIKYTSGEISYVSIKNYTEKLPPNKTEESFATNSFGSEEVSTEMNGEITNNLESNSNENVYTRVNEDPATFVTDSLDPNNAIKTTNSFDSEEVSTEINEENTNNLESNTRVNKDPTTFVTDSLDLNNAIKTTKVSPMIAEESSLTSFANSVEVFGTKAFEMDDENTNSLEINSNENDYTRISKNPAIFTTDSLDNLDLPSTITEEIPSKNSLNSAEVFREKSTEMEGENTNNPETNSKENLYTTVNNDPVTLTTNTLDNSELYSLNNNSNTDSQFQASENVTSPEKYSSNSFPTTDTYAVNITKSVNLVDPLEELFTESINTEIPQNSNNSLNFLENTKKDSNTKVTTDFNVNLTEREINVTDFNLVTTSYVTYSLTETSSEDQVEHVISLNLTEISTETPATNLITNFNDNLTEEKKESLNKEIITDNSYDITTVSWTNNFASETSNQFTRQTTQNSENDFTIQDLTTEFNPDNTTQDPRLPFRSPECRGANNRRQFKALKCFQYYQCFAGWAFLLNCHEGWWFEIEKGQCVLDLNKKCEL